MAGKGSELWKKPLEYISAVLLGMMVVVVFANVIFRYFLNFSLAFTEEISRFMFIWIVFIGAFLALVEYGHLGIDIVVKQFPAVVQKWIQILVDALMTAALIILFIGGVRLTSGNFSWPAPATGIPYGIVEIIVPIMSAAMLLLVVWRLVGRLISFKEAGREK